MSRLRRLSVCNCFFLATPDLRLPSIALAYAEFVRRLRECFPGAPETTIDGVRLETPDGFLLVRQSVTEPVVTMRLEGSSLEALHTLLTTCQSVLPEVSSEIARQTSSAGL